jgi:hypothetical protein
MPTKVCHRPKKINIVVFFLFARWMEKKRVAGEMRRLMQLVMNARVDRTSKLAARVT